MTRTDTGRAEGTVGSGPEAGAGASAQESTDECREAALFIDVANAEGVDFRRLLTRLVDVGHLEEMRAYGDFRQRHLDPVAIEFYLAGVEMVHCPSWPNGGRNDNGASKRKRTDDRLLEKGVNDLVRRRPSIAMYVLVTADADIIPTCHALSQQGREVMLICPARNNSLGHVLRQSGFVMQLAPMLPDSAGAEAPAAGRPLVRNGAGQQASPPEDGTT